MLVSLPLDERIIYIMLNCCRKPANTILANFDKASKIAVEFDLSRLP